MGIRVGTRLEQLLDLRRQITVQIELEARNNPDDAARLGLIKTSRRKARAARAAGPTVQQRLNELGVTTADVRTWARRQGLNPGTHGRIPTELVEHYATAHHQEHA